MESIIHLRTERILPSLERLWTYLSGRVGRKWHRSFRFRILVQSGFALTCLLLGVQFARFVAAARAGAQVLPARPPGVEGFLPIGGLLGVFDWVYQGTLNAVHPAATVLLLVFVALALLARKSFCSWVCPVGFLSDLLARVGRFFFGRTFRIWRWLDVPLRGLKYLLLGFFAWAIVRMPPMAVRGFIESPYYRLSDVRDGPVLRRALRRRRRACSPLLLAASILWQGFWCRYLCPYGALLGLVSWLSPMKIRRDPVSCIDCKLCDKACGARLPVSRKTAITSPECTGCLDCVAACPVQDALGIGLDGAPPDPRAGLRAPRSWRSSSPATWGPGSPASWHNGITRRRVPRPAEHRGGPALRPSRPRSSEGAGFGRPLTAISSRAGRSGLTIRQC